VTRYIAFLRAINVGGHVVKMDHLRALFESIPLADVSTFIASGNVIFHSKKPAAPLEAAIEKKLRSALGYEVAAMIRTPDELAGMVEHVEANELDAAGLTLYVGLLKTAPSAASVRAVCGLSNDVDLLSIRGREVYWQCRRNLLDSTLSGAKLEKLCAGAATFRNFNTVRRLAARTAA
jgi:uncharacterized protein (DUF1697 family)